MSESTSKFLEAVKRRYGDHGIEYAALGLAGEVGEVIELVKKSRYHGKTVDMEKYKEELGDVFFYLYAICHELMLDPAEVMRANVEKLAKRYPDGFVLGGGIR